MLHINLFTMLSIRFKDFAIILLVVQCAVCNFDEFIENEDPYVAGSTEGTAYAESTSRIPFNAVGIIKGIRTNIGDSLGHLGQNLGGILPRKMPASISTTDHTLTQSYSPTNIGVPQGSIVGPLLEVPYSALMYAKNATIFSGLKRGSWDPKADQTKEHGNMERWGRELAKKIGNVFQSKNATEGLDTNKTFFSGMMESFKKQVNFIYPGTFWCGEGDTSEKFSDLGTFLEPDKCCRAHDKCQHIIMKGETKHGLENTGMFTRSHCSCDKDFYKCLKGAKTMVAGQIGFTYFTILGPQCFDETKPIEGCTNETSGRCLSYKFNKGSKHKKHQWFDNPTF